MMTGRTALITGSNDGLGYAIAGALAEQGAQIVLHGICVEEAGNAAASALSRKTGQAVSFHRADLRQVMELEAMMHRIGPVDVLINNAVVRHFGSLDTLQAAQWDESIAVNLSAAFHTIRLATPAMRQNGWGRIINISSVFGHRGEVNRVGYVTTKTALQGLTRSVAIELSGTGITCNSISPGTVPTAPIMDRIAQSATARNIPMAEAERDYIGQRHPSGRFVASENVGALAAFLCAPAGADITGADFVIDGGWLAGR